MDLRCTTLTSSSLSAKIEKDRFSNSNLSVGITDRFMKALAANGEYDLVNPRTQKQVKRVKARAIFDLIVNAAWLTGDPGLIFLDEINRKNPTPRVGQIEATNPCGELPLLPYESCNLGSINLAKMARGKVLDWDKLRETIHWGIRFLDDVIEVNRFPFPGPGDHFSNRKVGRYGLCRPLDPAGPSYHSPDASVCGQTHEFCPHRIRECFCRLSREGFSEFYQSIHA
jgi:ribonucleoside-diphosphate reductase alpha chain